MAGRPLRADARRNRDQILAAARDVFVEQGASAPLEEIARRAGTGIATLYRRFPERRALMRAVVLEVLRQTAEAIARARAEEPDAFAALARYLHESLEIRAAAVIPALLNEIPLHDDEIERARAEAAGPAEELVRAAQREGTLRPDVAFGDIGPLIVRFARPLPGLPAELDRELSHRHVDIFLDGLRTRPDAREPGGPVLTLADLRARRQPPLEA